MREETKSDAKNEICLKFYIDIVLQVFIQSPSDYFSRARQVVHHVDHPTALLKKINCYMKTVIDRVT